MAPSKGVMEIPMPEITVGSPNRGGWGSEVAPQ